MKLSAELIEYPVLMAGNRYVSVCRRLEDLTKCSESAMKKKVYETATYIDSLGRRLKLHSIAFDKYAPPFWGFRLLKKREVIVSLEFEVIEKLSLEKIIDFVKHRLSNSHYGADPSYFKEIARNSSSVKDFFEKFDR